MTPVVAIVFVLALMALPLPSVAQDVNVWRPAEQAKPPPKYKPVAQFKPAADFRPSANIRRPITITINKQRW